MNHTYRIIWSSSLNASVVASELAGNGGKMASPRSRSRRRARVALGTAVTTLIFPLSAIALPTGGSVVAGEADIQAGGRHMTVNQGSDKAVINWDDFDIDRQESVRFNQNQDSAVLNRVTGTSASSIQGKLSADGHVFITNPNGVVFGPNATVDVGSLTATTKDIDTADFMDGGDLTLTGDSTAAVINEGDINADDGHVALVAARVINSGSIKTQRGNTTLAAADTVTLNLDDGSLVGVTIDQGSYDAMVENGGIIKADGGQVLLTAEAVDQVTKAAVNNTGVIEANTMASLTGEKPDTGSITLMADMDTGTTTVSGTLDASAPEGGDGGFIETSGAHVKVADETKITTKAPKGKNGTWLIDPVDFKIAPDFGDMTGQQLSDHLQNGDVVIQSTMGAAEGTGDIQVYDNVAWDNNTLTLDAINNVIVKATMTAGDDAGLDLKYKDEMIVAPGTGRIDFSGTGNTLTFNGKNVNIIHDINQLQDMRSNPDGWYALGSDIDASATKSWNGGKGFVGVRGFKGFFDGLGHVVDSLYMNDTSRKGSGMYGTGLFDTTHAGAKIRNTGMTNADITAYTSYGGILVGDGEGDISYSFTTGDFVGLYGNCFGGLAGHNTDGEIYNSFSSATVSGPSWVGGLVGHVTGSASFYQSYATGHVIGNGRSNGYGKINVGGLVGGLSSTAADTVRDSYSTVTISAPGYSDVGGLIGMKGRGSIVNSYWDVDVTGMNTSAGGVGLTSDQMRNPASFSGWDIDTSGGQAATWRMYDGKAAPMLKAFLKPAEAYMSSEEFVYNGKSQAVDLLQWSGVGVDPSRLHYTTNAGDITAKDVGEYDIFSSNFFSDPYGYDIIFHGSSKGQITITPADLTVRANDASKTYDGQRYTGGNGVTYQGFVDGEDARVLDGSLKWAGDSQGAIDAGDYTLSPEGLSSRNYALSYADGTLAVDKKNLIVAANSDSKVYDGQRYTGGNGVTFQGFVDGEDASQLAGTLQWSGDSQGAVDAGDYTLSPEGLSSKNYALSYADSALSVGKKDLVVAANSDRKVYDGQDYTGGNGATYQGLVNGEDASVLDGALKWAGDSQGAIDAGEYTISAEGLSSRNYDLNYVDGTLSVGKKNLVVAANSDSKVYDGQRYTGGNGVTYSGLADGEDASVLAGALEWSGDSQGAIDAGEYTISAGGLSSPNYVLSYADATLLVDKKDLVVAANGDSKVYDGQRYIGGNGVTYQGFIQGEDVSELSGTLEWSGDSQGAIDAGEYTLAPEGLSSKNYAFSYVDAALSVGKKNLVVAANSDSKVYDGQRYTGGNGVSYQGFVDGEDGSDLDGALEWSGDSQGAIDAGEYTLAPEGLSSKNYALSYADATLSVDKKDLVVAANSDSKVYDGQRYQGGNGVSYQGLVDGEDGSVLGGALKWAGDSQGAIDVGDYTLSPEGLSSKNYALRYADAALSIYKKNLLVAANSDSKIYDGQRYTGGNGVTYQGLVDGEDGSDLDGALKWSGDSQGAIDAGEYTLTPEGLSSKNYALRYANGVLSVGKKDLVVAANGDSKVYDGKRYTGGNGVTYQGFVEGEDASELAGTLQWSGDSQGAVDAGEYAISAEGLSSKNYAFNYVAGALSVGKKNLVVAANSDSKIYDGQRYTGGNGVTYQGFVDGEDASALAGTLQWSGDSQGAVDAGEYTLTPEGLSSRNYDLSYAAGGLSVGKKQLVVAANSDSKVYDGEGYTGGNGVTYQGLVAGDSSDGLDGSLVYSGSAQGAVNPGQYAIHPEGLSSGNYDIRYVDSGLDIRSDEGVYDDAAGGAKDDPDSAVVDETPALDQEGGSSVDTSAPFTDDETTSAMGGSDTAEDADSQNTSAGGGSNEGGGDAPCVSQSTDGQGLNIECLVGQSSPHKQSGASKSR